LSFDATSLREVHLAAQSVDSLDVIVSNSYSGCGGTVASSLPESYLSSYESVVVASSNLAKAFLPHMRKAVVKNNNASFIAISSMYGTVSPDRRIYDKDENVNPPFYGAAKAALIQWTKYAACEFAKENIRFNSISPGPFPSKTSQLKFPSMIDGIVDKVPMQRLGRPEELVGAVAFLASQHSSYITGINLPVDGGWTAW